MRIAPFLCLAVLLVGCNKDTKLTTEKDKFSYSIGWQMGSGLKGQGLDIDADKLAAGIRAAISGGKPQLTPQEMSGVMVAMQKKMMAERQKGGEENKKKGAEFLENNKKRKGVKTTKSGLQYEVLTQGKGKKPKATDKVRVHYKGTLIDGKEFDSSYKRGEPTEFPLNRVIRGWTEGLQLMPEGSKYKFFIPSDLAYGPDGTGGIPGNATLIFEVELIKIIK